MVEGKKGRKELQTKGRKRKVTKMSEEKKTRTQKAEISDNTLEEVAGGASYPIACYKSYNALSIRSILAAASLMLSLIVQVVQHF